MKKHIWFLPVLCLLLHACNKEEISISNSANQSFFIENKGATMPVWVRGNTASGTFVVYLHGGPGANAIHDFSAQLGDPFLKDHALVLWDQRHSGSTQGNSNLENYTLDVMAEDLNKLLKVLQHRYGKSKPVSLFLFSHSFGGALAVNFLVNPANQALVKGWINVDGAVDYVRNDTATQNILIKTGREQIALGKNVEEWEKYVQYALNNDPRSSIKVADQLEAYASRAQYLMEELNPENYGVKKIVENNKPYSISSQLVNKFTAWNHLSKELINFSPTQEQLANVSLPVLQIYGRYDFNVPLSLGRHLDKNISTPASQKSLMIFEHSAHNPFASEPDLFYSNVLAFIGQYK